MIPGIVKRDVSDDVALDQLNAIPTLAGRRRQTSSSSKTVSSDADESDSSIPVFGGLLGGLRKRQTDAELEEEEEDEILAFLASQGFLDDATSGLTKRQQLGGLIGGDKVSDDDQSSFSPDDGTSGANSFDAQEEAAAAPAAEKDADAEEPKEKEPGFLGGLGL